jgi:hypothetical protein
LQGHYRESAPPSKCVQPTDWADPSSRPAARSRRSFSPTCPVLWHISGMRPIDGFLRTLFITSKAVTRHMGGKRPGVILTLSERGGEGGYGGFLGHAVSSAGKEAFSAGHGRGAGAPEHPGHLHPSTRSDRWAGNGFLLQGALQAAGCRRRDLSRRVERSLGAGHPLEAFVDALRRSGDGGVPGLGSGSRYDPPERGSRCDTRRRRLQDGRRRDRRPTFAVDSKVEHEGRRIR